MGRALMTTNALATLIAEIEADPSLEDPGRLLQRIDALDRLEADLPDVRRADPHAASIDLALRERARDVRSRLERANRGVYRSIRRDIRRGSGATPLVAWAEKHRAAGDVTTPVHGEHYDSLDVLVGGVLRLSAPGPAVGGLGPEMVPYQPTPARHIFDLMDRTGLTARDVLVDLGSGLGHVPLLVSICTDAEAVGVELQPAYVESARRCARTLNLTRASFLQQDAREADLSVGTIFYLFTPFIGGILRSVLDSLHVQAASRAIRVCTLGPCTPMVAEEPWLKTEDAPVTDRIAIFSSRVRA